MSGECDRGSDRDEKYKMERVHQEEAGRGAANAKAPVEGADWCCEGSMGECPCEMRAETQQGLTTEAGVGAQRQIRWISFLWLLEQMTTN